MPPRYMERMQRQSATYRSMFGEPPPYTSARSRAESVESTMSADTGESQRPGKTRQPPPQYYQVGHPTAARFDKPALPLASLVLVTGANGWLGMHIVDQLLERGYRVRGTMRDSDKATATANYFREKYEPGMLTTTIVPDMARPGAFDLAAQGCAGIIHVASVMSYSPDPDIVIAPSIAGAINALEAAAKEPGVKRFVYCSASAAGVSQGNGSRNEVTHESWNMASFKSAWESGPFEADRAHAVFASMLPSVLWGKMLDPGNQGFRTSCGQLKSIFDGNAAATAWAPPQHFVDVQNSALLHVAALVLSDVQAQCPYNITSILRLLRMLYPHKAIQGDVSDHGVDLTVFKEAPQAEELLKRMGRPGWTDIETSVARNCEASV
ncbi:hypothetical protein LTR53_003617 [Teratosphaeriaceae sp. CCFEE 6253]|nr:hypothetical protein LTR53_003617 [Teratosphaeriaceae sp. CCFEE 6253]